MWENGAKFKINLVGVKINQTKILAKFKSQKLILRTTRVTRGQKSQVHLSVKEHFNSDSAQKTLRCQLWVGESWWNYMPYSTFLTWILDIFKAKRLLNVQKFKTNGCCLYMTAHFKFRALESRKIWHVIKQIWPELWSFKSAFFCSFLAFLVCIWVTIHPQVYENV